jgi:hypothetical protein
MDLLIRKEDISPHCGPNSHSSVYPFPGGYPGEAPGNKMFTRNNSIKIFFQLTAGQKYCILYSTRRGVTSGQSDICLGGCTSEGNLIRLPSGCSSSSFFHPFPQVLSLHCQIIQERSFKMCISNICAFKFCAMESGAFKTYRLHFCILKLSIF